MKLINTALIALLSLSSSAFAHTDYYGSVINLTGDEFKAGLNDLISGHEVLPYTQSGNDNWHDMNNIDVWEALVYTDSDCRDDNPHCGLVRLLYLNEPRHISKANRGGGSNDAWDREHIWPKSRGFPKKSQDGYTDLHHLRPADRNINGSHSNYGYDIGGEVVIDKLEDSTEKATEARLDTAAFSFEPPNHAKGQVARMLFYMAVRYDGEDHDPNEKMPDLVIRDDNARVKEPWIGDLCTLLEWHNRYGPTEFEKRRNDRVMEVQGNRNPFIDHPGWANLIWAAECY
ncbi:endonuclease I family protein [Gilvimarinus sp. 1_MG-2023]|uniref:endonuclease I family protein n=1 Tax=Gilvimarinus sp. 1_MG-2023 TaxID=3062638 RepID=UPI0026E483C6|nr:endonuclease [Gilvimarinus sp. 1_MG-2023]MDO6748523.1 endonuclease [Gilvimarinus sp. 1_MG-2023]